MSPFGRGCVRELRCLALLERVVHWIFGGTAESQVAPGESLERSQRDLTSWLLMIQEHLLNVSRNVELDLSGDGSVYPARRLPGWCLLQMDVVEDLLDHVWLGDRCDDAQPTTALGTHFNIYFFEDPLEWYVTRRSAQESGARGRSVSRSVLQRVPVHF